MDNYSSKERIGVIGAGSWGTTLAHRVALKGFPVKLWCRRKEVAEEIKNTRKNSLYTKDYILSENIEPTTDLRETVEGSDVIIIAVVTKAFREICRKIGDFIQPDQIVLSASKGIEQDSLKRMSEIIREETAALKIGVISGPNLALEVLAEHPTATVIASRFDEVVTAGTRILNYGIFRTYASHDIVGVELAGALKNVLAIASGIISGLGYGANTRGFLISRGVAEIIRLGSHYQIDPLTISGLAGVGDITVTCSSEKSRNFTFGYKMGKGQKPEEILNSMHQVVEGVRTAKSAHQLAQKFGEELPIFETVYRILYENMTVEEAHRHLLGRPIHFEHQRERQISDNPEQPIFAKV